MVVLLCKPNYKGRYSEQDRYYVHHKTDRAGLPGVAGGGSIDIEPLGPHVLNSDKFN